MGQIFTDQAAHNKTSCVLPKLSNGTELEVIHMEYLEVGRCTVHLLFFRTVYLLGRCSQIEDADGGASRCSGSAFFIKMLPGEASALPDYLTGRQIKPVVLTRDATVRLQVGIQAKQRCLVHKPDMQCVFHLV